MYVVTKVKQRAPNASSPRQRHSSVSLRWETRVLTSPKERTDGQMFILCNFPAESLKQKAVPGSFIMKGKEAFRGGHAHVHTQRLFRFDSNQVISQKLDPHFTTQSKAALTSDAAF